MPFIRPSASHRQSKDVRPSRVHSLNRLLTLSTAADSDILARSVSTWLPTKAASNANYRSAESKSSPELGQPPPLSQSATTSLSAPPSSPAGQSLTSHLTTNMCTKIIHVFKCGHQQVDLAPCAASRVAKCPNSQDKKINHDQRCSNCRR